MSDRPVFLSRLALPVSWQTLDRAPSAAECETAASANANVIGFLLQGANLDAVPRPSDEDLAEALAPLRIKLDIVIELLERLTYRGVTLPPVRDIEFGTQRIAWHSPRRVSSGDWLRIELYFDPRFLEPIILYGRVESAVADDAADGCGIQAELADVPPQTEEAFARLAFLAQRRQLAQRAGAARSER